MELLRLKQIVKNEDNRKILDNINLLIEPFSKTALIGETGSGKSTLMYNLFSARGENKVLRKCFNHIFFIYAK